MQRQFTRLIALAMLGLAMLAGNLSAAAESGAVPQRSDIDDKYKWKVEDIYANLEQWEADFAQSKNSTSAFDQFKGKLGESAGTLVSCLQLSDSLWLVVDNLYVYAYLKLDEDNRESKYQELGDRASTLRSELSQATAFIEPEIIAIEGDRLQEFLKGSPKLNVYRHYLEDMTRKKAHILDSEKEEILAMAGQVTSAPSKIFSMINNADMKYGSIFDEDSNQVELTKERYYKFMESSDRRVRRDASNTYVQAYVDRINSLAASLTASVKVDHFYMKARKYNSCLEMSLNNFNIPVSVFHNLIDAVNANLEPLHRWAALKKRMMGYDTLHTYDRYAPLFPDQKKEYTYEQAKEVVLKGLKPMGKEYLEITENGFNSGWIDVYETQGKESGAYNWGTYTSHPYILLNYNNTLENVFTIGHEMGHALHSYYTTRNEPYIYGDHALFVAEVSSTCNEAVMMKYLLQETTDKKEKMYLLNYYIEQIIGTFYTQVMFSEFELAIHERVESGNALSANYLRKTYRDIYQKYWGPELFIAENNDIGGMRISHFYRQYYVYQYATCYSAAQMLSQKILEQGEEFMPTYIKFLSTGTSSDPVDVLKAAGVDMSSPEPINRTISLFADLVRQMEQMLGEG